VTFSASPRPRVDLNQGRPKFDITLDSTVLTATHYYEPRTIELTGLVTAHNDPAADRHPLSGLQVTVGGVTGQAILSESAPTAPYTVTWRFPWRLPSKDTLPDGVSYTAVLTATDSAGRTTPKTVGLVADVIPPAPVTLTLSSGGAPLGRGAVVRAPSPELVLTWTPSSDGSGLAGYTTTWTAQSAETTTLTSEAHGTSGPLEGRITGGEAQQITAGLGIRDRYGNVRWQSAGPVYADTPLTPDYIMPNPSPGAGRGAGGEGYSSWMDSGCSLLGVDRRLQRQVARYGARRAPQRFYATRDSRALRLAWTGANWSADGDLFIYLDVGPGGTGSVFTPYPAPTENGVYLAAADADRVVWVQDSHTASLLRWDGATWITDTLLTDAEYRFNPSLRDGQSDLYLPFALLGTDPSSHVGVLAFAAEDHVPGARLQVWSIVPHFNPLNSRRVNPIQIFAPEGGVAFGLSHPYTWDGLGEGMCPNGTQGSALAGSTGDADLQLDITSDPAGLAISGPRGGIYWVPAPEEMAASLPSFLRVGQPPLDDGQEVLYTIRYHNAGIHAATGVWLKLNALGPLCLRDGSSCLPDSSVTLGDIEPGAVGEATFRAIVNQGTSDRRLAAVVGRLYDAAHGTDGPALEWLLVAHRIDQGAPETGSLAIEYLGRTVGPDAMVLKGYAHNESGVRNVKLEVTAPSGRVSVMDCPVPRPQDGRWSCDWDVTGSNGGRPSDGEEFGLRLQVTDRFGHTSEWIGPWTVKVDALPPAVAADAAATQVLRGSLIQGDTLTLFGDVQDAGGVGAVQVCLDERCNTAELWGSSSMRWSHRTPELGMLDHVTRTFTVWATDRHGNRTAEPLALPVTFDNVAPVITAVQMATQAFLGSKLPVLNGTVTDGGPSASVSVRVQPPSGDMARMAAARDGEAWQFELPADLPGRYTLWVDAEDPAGNVATVGPYTVDVTCTDAALLISSLTAEPVAGFPMSLTLTAVISNTGPDSLPAGIPINFTESAGAIGSVTSTAPLSAGESQALSIVWTPEGARDYAIVGQIGNLSYSLCSTPPQAHFSPPMRDLPLYTAWNLVSPPVDPGNTDVQVVQRGIKGAYTAILGHDGGPLAYYPDRPQESTLATVDALHGYWIRAIAPSNVPPEDLQGDEQISTWRMAGELLPEEQPVPLRVGWNLVGYLPRRPLTITTALQNIESQYGAVLGFERTALSYYPDLDASYNTLYRMAPGYGYWINARGTVTLSYPVSVITETAPFTPSLTVEDWQAQIRMAEWEDGVQPTVEWMNFYGKAALPDGMAVPTGTVVLALDPQGVICGANPVWTPGQYGLLACCRDDPVSDTDEGAVPGDTIRLVLGQGSPPAPGDVVIGEGTWVAHGARQQVPPGGPSEQQRTFLPLLLSESSMPVEAPEPAAESEEGASKRRSD
jgi:hypothetical protein